MKIILTKKHGLDLYVAVVGTEYATFFSKEFAQSWAICKLREYNHEHT